MFDKILIANRGEIACRIMRTARKMAVKTVAVFSDADKNALHVQCADEAVHVGPSPALESYLKIENIIEAAIRTGAEAIHPGYGFLSENPDFVEAVEAAGLVFIGPSAGSIRAMGLKDAAKNLMASSGVPVVPGYHGANQNSSFLAAQATKIGYPVLIKARAGGGGKGMRLVHDAAGFETALEGAVREGKNSFGDGHVLIEKFVSSPRHIEIQVFGDAHGNVVHMFERDCSLQRRHQKVIEEAPAPGMSDAMRGAMGQAAVNAAKAVNYQNAGTVEFIVDGRTGGNGELRSDRFWFMEMNTRLQVEHPVTEMITGLDLVELQLQVADGQKLPFAQEDLSIHGWAFETRLYAENPANGFLPSVGEINHFALPEKIARIDAGVAHRAGSEYVASGNHHNETNAGFISPHYDPMIGKMITHGTNRKIALEKMRNALEHTYISGVNTNVAFLSALCNDEEFAAGGVDTGLIDRQIDQLIADGEANDRDIATGAVMILRKQLKQQSSQINSTNIGWRNWGPGRNYVDFQYNDRECLCTIIVAGDPHGNDKYHVDFDGQQFHLRVELITGENWENDKIRVGWDGGSIDLVVIEAEEQITVIGAARTHIYQISDPLEQNRSQSTNSNLIIAPMPGMIKAVKVKAGEKVSRGQVLVILEAMKMEHSLIAHRDGHIDQLPVEEGQQVEDAALLASLVEVGAP